jgi:hypothetical protein
MRVRLWLAALLMGVLMPGVGSLAGWAQDHGAADPVHGAGDPAVVVEFTNPSLSPPHWTLTIHPDGSGHFQSQMGTPPAGGLQEIDAPDVSRDVRLSADYAAHVFEVAQRSRWFNTDCESHLKVAFQGWKKLSYAGPQGSGSCTFNYSKDKDIQAMGDSLVAVADTILEGARLETLLQHDRLGLDKETEYLVDAAQNGRAQQLGAISDILTRLAADDTVMERVRKRARLLLAEAAP